MTRPTTRGSSDHPAPIDCETAVRRLWDFVDGRLPAMSHDEVEAHLATCAGCPPHFAFARKLRSALAASRELVAPAQQAALRARLRIALAEARNQQARDDEPLEPGAHDA